MLFLTLGVTLLMAVGGFLFYNSPPKVHLGKGGSLFLRGMGAAPLFLVAATERRAVVLNRHAFCNVSMQDLTPKMKNLIAISTHLMKRSAKAS